jgi:hypothetical protein
MAKGERKNRNRRVPNQDHEPSNCQRHYERDAIRRPYRLSGHGFPANEGNGEVSGSGTVTRIDAK